MSEYDRRFFNGIRDGCRRSAEAVAPLLRRRLPPGSVVDVGSGEGWWGKALEDEGASPVVGIDGAYVQNPVIEFVAADLGEPLPDCGTFNLALCLEVAEHLQPERAEGFVAELCAFAPTIVFSAAVPGQGGNGHLNEQWPGYWVELFAECGYPASGALRWEIWGDERVCWWYRQNLIVFGDLCGLPKDGAPAVVHPAMWRHHGHA